MNGQLSSYSFMSRLETSMCDVVLLLLEDKSIQVCTQMIVELAMSVDKEHHHGYSSYTSAVFTVAHSKTLIRSVTLLSKQSNWRVRKMVCAVIPKLVACSTTVEKRSAISDIAQPLLYDPVFEVRRSAARAMCISAECDGDATGLALAGGVTPDGEPLQDMGRMWLDCVVLPQLESLRTSRVYSNRILSLHMIATIIVEDIVHEGDVRYDILINIALTLSSDRVPNVRIALCEVLVVLAPLIRQDSVLYEAAMSQAEDVLDKAAATSAYHRSNSSLPNMVRSTITTLQNDMDRDVAYLADKASRYMDRI
ncbi:pppA, partial [Symbiodinium microadriaticum]